MYSLILNPYSGRGAAEARLRELTGVLDARGLRYELKRADSKEALRETARRAVAEGVRGIIAVGGDGTLFEVANGMAGSDVPLLFASCGTGNDFVKSLHLPADPVAALKLQLDAPISSIDIGRMNDTYFLNVSGTGFDVDVLNRTEKYKVKYTGLQAYLYGLHDAIHDYKPMEARVRIDDGPEETLRFAILSVGNGRYIGGGMKAVPGAIVDDGLFDAVIVKPVKKWMILPLIALFITGKHVPVGLGRVHRCKKISIHRDSGFTVNLDGELVRVDGADYELCPGALRVRIPPIVKK